MKSDAVYSRLTPTEAAKEWRKIQIAKHEFNKRYPAPGAILTSSTYCWEFADSCERCFREYGECGIKYRDRKESIKQRDLEQLQALLKKYAKEILELPQ